MIQHASLYIPKNIIFVCYNLKLTIIVHKTIRKTELEAHTFPQHYSLCVLRPNLLQLQASLGIQLNLLMHPHNRTFDAQAKSVGLHSERMGWDGMGSCITMGANED